MNPILRRETQTKQIETNKTHTLEQTAVYLLTQKSTLEPGIKVQPDTLQTNVRKQTTNRKMPFTTEVVKNAMEKSYNVYLSTETSGVIIITGLIMALSCNLKFILIVK